MKNEHPRLRSWLWRVLGGLALGVAAVLWFSLQLKLVGGLVFWAGMGLFVGLGTISFMRGKQYAAPGARTLREHDLRPPVVYLRSFQRDAVEAQAAADHLHVNIPFLWDLTTAEEQLARALADIGPVIAIGQPGEPLPPVGAAREYVAGDDWQSVVREWMSQARLVVIATGATSGLLWEIQEAVARMKPEQLVLLIPRETELYDAFREQTRAQFPEPLPEYVVPPRPGFWHRMWVAEPNKRIMGNVRALVYFKPDWTPVLVPVDRRPGTIRNSTTTPLVGGLRLALRPVYDQLQLRWSPPAVNVALVGFLALLASPLVLCVGGVAFMMVIHPSPR